ncbi:hypothetical protein DFH29DRAFT_1069813 [Suillus ampliporus]|nr:hypothetical protein DFH29DRAFT_1069813 [Suillus ampliporus]
MYLYDNLIEGTEMLVRCTGDFILASLEIEKIFWSPSRILDCSRASTPSDVSASNIQNVLQPTKPKFASVARYSRIEYSWAKLVLHNTTTFTLENSSKLVYSVYVNEYSFIVWMLIWVPVSDVHVRVYQQKVSVLRLLGIALLFGKMPEGCLAQCTQEVVSSSEDRGARAISAGASKSLEEAKDVETHIREVRQQFPGFSNKLVLMPDMTVFPTEIHVFPLHKLQQFPGDDPIWPEIADEIRE